MELKTFGPRQGYNYESSGNDCIKFLFWCFFLPIPRKKTTDLSGIIVVNILYLCFHFNIKHIQ